MQVGVGGGAEGIRIVLLLLEDMEPKDHKGQEEEFKFKKKHELEM